MFILKSIIARFISVFKSLIMGQLENELSKFIKLIRYLFIGYLIVCAIGFSIAGVVYLIRHYF